MIFLQGAVVLLTLSCASLSFEDIGALLADLPRHNSSRYITRHSLRGDYFATAYGTLEDPHVYIVLSDTKSPASRVIGFFTRAAYNHVSLSFDPALETLVSYNGGDGFFGPGLNHERLERLNRKPGASLAVFRLGVTAEQKRALIGRVAAINREGSSYNLRGLVTKKSRLPNIMFCSQFVYTLLKDAGAAYFDKENGKVAPMDFVSQHGKGRPEFAGKIFFDRRVAGAVPSGGPGRAWKNSSFFSPKTLDSRSITSYNLIQRVEKE
ncbi:MAG: hypothetical protein LBP23_08765 [Treponema sp.]|nr:hypothetical protein [Treponema sp.]